MPIRIKPLHQLGRVVARLSVSVFLVFALFGVVPKLPSASSSDSSDSNWPMFQHDTRHTGRSSYLGILSSPTVLWEKQFCGGEAGSGMSRASDGTVYVAACGVLSAVDPEDGTVLWTHTGGFGGGRSTPAVAPDGTIYWGSGDSFEAITPSGQVAWIRTGLSYNYVFSGSPVIAADGTIYVGHDALWSFTPTGDLRWVQPFSWFNHASPATNGGSIVYMAGDGFEAVTTDGNVLWQHSVDWGGGIPAVGDDGTIYIGARHDNLLYAFNPDGTQKWVFASDIAYDSGGWAPVIGASGTIYLGITTAAPTAAVYAINPDGSLKWKSPVSGSVFAPPVVDRSDNVFVCTYSGSCYGINSDGELLWEYIAQPGAWNSTAPLITSNGTILILDGTGMLHCLGDPTLPRLQASPNSLLIALDYGSSTTTSTLQLASTLSPITWTASLASTSDWITVPITTGTTPNALQIIIEPNGLVTGTYDANLILSAGTDNVANVPLFTPIKILIGAHRLYLPIVDR